MRRVVVDLQILQLHIEKQRSRARDNSAMKMFTMQQQVLSSNPRIHILRVCNPSTVEAETGNSLGLADQSAYPN